MPGEEEDEKFIFRHRVLIKGTANVVQDVGAFRRAARSEL